MMEIKGLKGTKDKNNSVKNRSFDLSRYSGSFSILQPSGGQEISKKIYQIKMK